MDRAVGERPAALRRATLCLPPAPSPRHCRSARGSGRWVRFRRSRSSSRSGRHRKCPPGHCSSGGGRRRGASGGRYRRGFRTARCGRQGVHLLGQLLDLGCKRSHLRLEPIEPNVGGAAATAVRACSARSRSRGTTACKQFERADDHLHIDELLLELLDALFEPRVAGRSLLVALRCERRPELPAALPGVRAQLVPAESRRTLPGPARRSTER